MIILGAENDEVTVTYEKSAKKIQETVRAMNKKGVNYIAYP